MKKEFRIKKTQEIEQVMKNQKSVGSKELRIFIKKNDETGHFRYAISVGKKIGNAVERNKYKRRLRAIVSTNSTIIPSNLDIFIVSKPELTRLNYKESEKLFLYLLKKINKN